MPGKGWVYFAVAYGVNRAIIAGLYWRAEHSQGLEIIRVCRGLDVVGGDLVEVALVYDITGNTALTAANLLFEMLMAWV